MKRSSCKGALVVAGTLFLMGAALCGIALGVKGFDISALTVHGGRSRVDVVIQPEDCASVTLDLTTESLYIGVSDDDMAHLTYYDTKDGAYDLTSTGGSTELRWRRAAEGRRWYEFINLNFSGLEESVVLLLPEGRCGKLSASCSTGAVRAENLSVTGELRIECSTGAITALGCSAGGASLRSSTGSVEFEALSARDVALEASTGSISGSLTGAPEDYTITSHSSTGSNNLTDRLGGTRTLSAHTSTGSIDITFKK